MPTARTARIVIGLEVVDVQTGRVVRRYAPEQRRAAYRACDRLDRAYGAARYTVRLVWPTED